MADDPKAGTPVESGAVGGDPAGTTPASKDGGWLDNLTPDQKALIQANEAKAAEGNRALVRAQAAEERLATLERQLFNQQADPMAQRLVELNQRAVLGDMDAQAELQTRMASATQQWELELNDAMIEVQVPHNLWNPVKALIRQSGYRMTVPQALAQARGSTEAPLLQDRLRTMEEENRRLKEALDGRTPGPSRPNLSTPPAPDTGLGEIEMDPDEYAGVLNAGGPAAIALRNRKVRFKRG